MSDRANKPGSEAENPIASLKPRSKPKERALPFDMDQILAVKDDVASGQWKTPADASGQSAHGRETTEPRVPTSPETHDDQGPSETTAEPAPRRSAIASRVGKTRAPAPRDEHPLFKRDLVKVNVRMTREDQGRASYLCAPEREKRSDAPGGVRQKDPQDHRSVPLTDAEACGRL